MDIAFQPQHKEEGSHTQSHCVLAVLKNNNVMMYINDGIPMRSALYVLLIFKKETDNNCSWYFKYRSK